MGHRFKNTGDFVPGSICEACGAGLDHPEHDTTPGEKAAEDAAEKAVAMREVLQAERDVALLRVRELYRALGSGGGDILSDAELAQALDKISSLRNHATCADETLTRVRGEHDLAKTRVAALRGELDLSKTRVNMLRAELDAQGRKNDEAHIEIASLRRLLNERQEAATEKAEAEHAVLQAEHSMMVSRLRDHTGLVDITKEAQHECIKILQKRLDDLATKLDTCENARNDHSARWIRLVFALGLKTRDHEPYDETIDRACTEIELLRQAPTPAGALKSATPTAFDLSTKRLLERAALSPSGKKIVDECFRLAEMLIEKNIAYGDSALNPVRVFAKDIDTRAQILVRLDDKLSRLSRGSAAGEDVILDLLGYLILYRIAPATAPAEKPAVDFLKSLVVREPTPEEVATLRKTAEESEKNSPYRERRRFVECPACAAKPGSPVLCYHCLMRRAAEDIDFTDRRGTQR